MICATAGSIHPVAGSASRSSRPSTGSGIPTAAPARSRRPCSCTRATEHGPCVEGRPRRRMTIASPAQGGVGAPSVGWAPWRASSSRGGIPGTARPSIRTTPWPRPRARSTPPSSATTWAPDRGRGRRRRSDRVRRRGAPRRCPAHARRSRRRPHARPLRHVRGRGRDVGPLGAALRGHRRADRAVGGARRRAAASRCRPSTSSRASAPRRAPSDDPDPPDDRAPHEDAARRGRARHRARGASASWWPTAR